MCWTDLLATRQILQLKKDFNINTAITTGTFWGTDVQLYAQYFDKVYSMDIEDKYLAIARSRLKSLIDARKVELLKMNSWEFIKLFRQSYDVMHDTDTIFFYLDAHFYDPTLPDKDRWVAVKELRALRGFKNCVIVIHDFDAEGLGHLVYDNIHFGWNVVGRYIKQINPDFHYYTNTRGLCEIVNEQTVKELPITIDEHILNSVEFVNSSDVKKYRGILYATPKPLDLNRYQLKELKVV